VPVCAVGCLKCLTDRFLDVGSGIGPTESAPVVVERGPRKLCESQEQGKRVVRLEVVDSSNFQRRSGDLKARNFPKYATSARSRSFSRRKTSVSLSGGESPRMVGGLPRGFGRSPSSPSRR